MSRIFMCVMAFVVVFAVGIARVQATTWDAVSGWQTGSNVNTNIWQYYRVWEGTTGYELLPNPVDWGGGQYAWTVSTNQTTYVCNVPSIPSILDVSPAAGAYDVAVGWQSPIAGTVDLSYSVTMPVDASTNGVEYWVLQGGTQLGHGILTSGQTTGTVSAPGLSVATGDKLYLRVGGNGGFGYDDTRVTMTVTSVPEPSTLVLLACGLMGLLAYAWRKRR